jgi:hypothetical protein
LRTRYDTTGDGRVDVRVSLLSLDTASDGRVDTVGLDTNGDGRYDTAVPLAVAGRQLLRRHLACAVATPYDHDAPEWRGLPEALATPVGLAPPEGDVVDGSRAPPFVHWVYRKGGLVEVVDSGLRGTVVKLTRTAAGSTAVLVRLDIDGALRPFPGSALCPCAAVPTTTLHVAGGDNMGV